MTQIGYSSFKRQIRIYGVGAPKTGTHSIAGLFSRHFRAEHEIECENMIKQVMSPAMVNHSWLLMRDRRLNLDVEVSSVLRYFVEDLVELFPHSKFILTIRSPLEWVHSIITHMHLRPASEIWRAFREYRFGRPSFVAADRSLQAAGLYSIDSLLDYWVDHNRSVLETVPAARLLTISTNEISNSIDQIAEFATIQPHLLDESKCNLFQSRRRSPLLAEIPDSYIYERAKEICGDIWPM